MEKLKSQTLHERDFLISLFERMADGVCVVSGAERLIEYINPSLKAVFGEAEGNKCHQVFFLRDAPCDHCPFSPGGTTGTQKRELSLPGGKTFEMVETELENPEGGKSWLMVFRDITERKWLENELVEINRDLELKVQQQTAALLEQERLAALGEISAGLAHEIRNPLSAILSGIALLESKKRGEAERSNIIDLIKREARRLNASLTDFLLFARPQKPKTVRNDLNSLIREIVQLIEDDREMKGGIEVILDLEAMPPIWFDDDQLRQLIWNIALNALQAMQGKGRLELRTRKTGEGWRLEVRDTGPGIPEPVRDRVFDPFFSTKKEGTGLGLSIVRRIVQTHGGSIEFQTEEGGGTAFIITAPDHPSEADPSP